MRLGCGGLKGFAAAAGVVTIPALCRRRVSGDMKRLYVIFGLIKDKTAAKSAQDFRSKNSLFLVISKN